ncbi:MAG: hypothetical protein ABH967_00650 [Patescibacteria group bacterium]
MNRNFRKLLFLLCFFLFITITPLSLLYSQGYRIDLNSGDIKITQTGGLFLRIQPKEAEIYLNSKLRKKTDFLFASALIENLIPKKYNVTVKKEGYHSWYKQLGVEEKKVIAFENILLIPENPEFKITSTNVSDFYAIPNSKKIITKELNNDGWALKLYDTDKRIKSHLLEEKEVYSKGAELLSLEMSPDSKNLFLEIGMKEQIKNFILNIDEGASSLQEDKTPKNLLVNIVICKFLEEKNYCLDNNGNLFQSNKSFEEKIKLTESPFPIQLETKYVLEIQGNLIFLKENEKLYLLDEESKTFELFAEDCQGIKKSFNSEKLVYFSEHEVWIMFLADQKSQPYKKAGDKIFLIRLSEKINDITWLDSDHIILSNNNKVLIGETDERNGVNMVDLAIFDYPKIIFNQSDKKLYVLSDNNIYQSIKLIP